MHIIYVPESFPQPSETFVINEIDGLLGLGYQITVTPRIEGDFANTQHARLERIMKKIKLVDSHGNFGLTAFVYALIYGGQLWQGWRPNKVLNHIKLAGNIARHVSVIKAQKPDLILIHFGYNNAVAGVIAARALRVPSLLWMHGSDMYTVPHRSLHWLTANVSSVITNSSYSQGLLESLGVKNKVSTSNLGVNIEKFKPSLPEKKEINPTIICIARIGHNKNHVRLIKVFHRVLDEIPNAKLWLVGDGKNRKECESLISTKNKESIVFWGALSQEKVVTLLEKSWIKVLLSEKEALGVAFMEAQSAGLPCIASDVGGIPEVIKMNETGFLFDLDSPEFNDKLVQSIVNILDDDALRKKMGVAARIRAEAFFDEKDHIKRMDKLIKQSVKGE